MTFFALNTPPEPVAETRLTAALRSAAVRSLGAVLVLLGLGLTLMLATHAPGDPSLFNAVSHAPSNALGTLGSYGSDILLRVFGWAAWVWPVASLVWGARFATLNGADRWPRILMLPLAAPVLTVFAAAHVPSASWSFATGLGGILGDDLLTRLVPLVASNAALLMPVLTIALGLAAITTTLLAFGVDAAEARLGLRGFWRGLGSAFWGLRHFGTVLRILGQWIGTWARLLLGAFMHWVLQLIARRQRVTDDTVEEPDRLEPGFAAQSDPWATDSPAPLTADTPIADWNEDEDGRARLMDRLTSGLAKLKSERSDVPLDDDTIEHDPFEAFEAPDATPIPDHLARVQHATKKPTQSRQARSDAQPRLALETEHKPYDGPSLSLLQTPMEIRRTGASDEALSQNAKLLEAVLDEYGIGGEITAVRPGPVVTMYELEPAPGLKASRVIGLADDIARSMSALAARVSTVPGRKIIGIELPNDSREKVYLRELLSTRAYGDGAQRLPLALGKDIGGEPVITNLAKMPHLLIAGTTGSGKSVAINTMILSLLYKLSPDECRMIMIDPKMLELSVYDGIPHLLSPVVTDPKKAVVALKWVVAEMEERYRKMSKMGVRNIDGYNGRVSDALAKGEAFTRTVQTGFDDATGEPVFETEEFAPEKMPYIVVVVDEMADLMMVAGKEIEACIQRLAQMARASGIHLIMATQRPSVDVITGTIKANFPTRISFQVTSKIDSRTILGEQGAEQLLGMGDMLYMANGGKITRVHGPFCTDEEVEEVVAHLKTLGAPDYVAGVVEGPDDDTESDIDLVLGLGGNTGGEDALYDQAVAIVARDRKCSTSYIQRKLAIGYNKAARLVEQMEDEGVVSQANKVGKREILVPEVG
ncbi:MAG: DNA translocase FtsK 4TM domain-containing protein [Pseudomonadota bacterium]